MDAPESLALPLRGPAVNVLQLSGSRSYTSDNASQGVNYEQDISKKRSLRC
jgi:hypothetical protein